MSEFVAATAAGLIVGGEVAAVFLLGPHRPLVWPWVRRYRLNVALKLVDAAAGDNLVLRGENEMLLDELSRVAAGLRRCWASQDLITRPGNPDPNKPAEVA